MCRSIRVFEHDHTTLNVCPYSYNVCLLPEGWVCKIQKSARTVSEITEWEKVTITAQICESKGQSLTTLQYEHRRIGTIR